jgi:glycerol-3-phosphate dehydrogenase
LELEERGRALAQAEQTADLLVVGGGITGAATATRPRIARSSSSVRTCRHLQPSKLIHGGFRYIAEGQLA